ncbi:hypothetical protein PsYK624_025570 [Phanerochaete sordida]|uniref:Uncharacterized protein n=1 Tax=Phanerochaete sordida TaxID=48140 RepID=A0A9P3G1N8_9APHY|nr:hypothetical protein PsYK624_025570 [Phanerochaete sordida]
MALITPSIDLFLFTSLLTIPPSWVLLRRRRRATRSRTPNTNVHPPYERLLTVLLHLHTFYILYCLIVHWPPNLFSALKLPLTTPTERIRSILLERAGLTVGDGLPRPLEELLAKLGNAEIRTAYVRYGQKVIQDCVHCKTIDHYSLFAIPGPLLQYIREATVLGLLTVENSGRSRLRTLGLLVLGAAAVAEAWTVATVQISIQRDDAPVVMWHDVLYVARHVLFLVLPVLLYLLPASAVPPPLTPLVLQMRASVDMLARRVTLLKYLQPAVMRDERLRAAATSWWGEQKTVGQWVTEDEGVWRAARRDSGAKNGDEQLKEQVRIRVKDMLRATGPGIIPPVQQ